MFGQSPIVISGDPIILGLALIFALGTFGLFILKVADKWYKYKHRKAKPNPRAADDLLT